MPVYDEPSTPVWTERFLIIDVLREHISLQMTELWRTVHERQIYEVKKLFHDSRLAHSRSAFRYWRKSLESQGLIAVEGNAAKLTPLGNWLAQAREEEFNDSVNFLDSWRCTNCGGPTDLAFFTPLFGRSRTNRNERTWVAGTCGRCGNNQEGIGLPSTMTPPEFAKFYNRAIQ